MAGDLSQAETLYRSILARDPDHPRALHNLGVVALRMGHPNAAESLLRRAIARAPEMAEAYSNLGLSLAGQDRGREARVAFEQAVTLRPDFADAWSNLAILDQNEADTPAAVRHFRRARDADPDRAAIAANLGAVLIEAGEVDEGLEILERILPRLQHSAPIHFNLGKGWFLLGALPAAIGSFRQAIALDPGFADAHHTLAHALLAAGQLAEGWREYEWRWRAKRFRVPPRDFAIPRWTGDDLEGRRILVWSEQGVGDKLLFAGLLPELVAQGCEVTVEIEERLVALFRRSFPEINVVARRDASDLALNPREFDVQAPIGDLPRYLRPSLDGFRPLGAYLAPDKGRTRDLRKKYQRNRAPLIGVAWASRSPKGIPLEAFAPMLRLPGARWVSLQYGEHGDEIARVNKSLNIEIAEDTTIDAIADFDGSVAQAAALDAVITIRNATLYTAAGLGLPTFALTPAEPDWRWLGCDHSPWHETVRLYRQDRTGYEAGLSRMTSDVKFWLDHFPR